MTREEAQAIYHAGEETVVRVLMELSARVDQLTADFALLKAENIVLRERVLTLEGQLAKDSHNSHKPPSSDGLSKPSPKSLRPPSQRRTGGQPGHPGHTLRMVEKPDRTVTHRVERCTACGQSLETIHPDRIERRQVHDLPEPKLEITEHDPTSKNREGLTKERDPKWKKHKPGMRGATTANLRKTPWHSWRVARTSKRWPGIWASLTGH